MPKRLTQEEFIERCKEIHGNKYSYDKLYYTNNNNKVEVVCPEHGSFFIRAADFIRGRGCSKCAGVKQSSTEEFIKKAQNKYGDRYDYSKVVYVNNKTKVCIICHQKDKFGNEHGEFWQRPNDHLSGYQCPKCGNEYIPTTDEWIKSAQYVHGDKYDYSKVVYKNAKEKVCIVCPEHGEFWQIPNNHLQGCCCPNCNSDTKSKMEEGINKILSDLEISYERQKTFDWLKNKHHLYLDFYLKDYNIGIEVQGEQHFRPIQKFGGVQCYNLQKERDTKKEELCKDHNIPILYITKKNYKVETIVDFINVTTNKR